MRKGILIFIMGLSLLMTGCKASEGLPRNEENVDSVAGTDTESAVEHLMNVWSDYLSALDRMYASELWALDYVDAYLESGDWDDLAKARTACIASAGYLTELSMSVEDLSEEEYLILTDAGIDTGYQTLEFSGFEDVKELGHSVIRDRLLEGLECDVFFEKSVKLLKEEVSLQKDYIDCMCREICYETNYLLYTIRDYADVVEYWSAIQEMYPALSAGRSEWLETEPELNNALDACLDEYDEILMTQSDLISRMEADLYQMTQLVQNKNIDALKASAYHMSNVPSLLPLPQWYAPESTGYLGYTLSDDGGISYPESGEELTDADGGVYMMIEEVSREDVEEYIEIAEDYASAVEQDGTEWYITMPGYSVKIEWENDTVTILFSGEDITFAPSWYIRER